MTPEELNQICIRLDKIILMLSDQNDHHWCCGCGHWNGANLSTCAVCGRKPNGEYP